jgi:hypothetical protein
MRRRAAACGGRRPAADGGLWSAVAGGDVLRGRRPAAYGGGLLRLMRGVNWGRVVPIYFLPNRCVRRWLSVPGCFSAVNGDHLGH